MDLLGPALARIVRLEAAAADALAPAEEVRSDGWRLRFNHGVSRRGNSVLAESRGRASLASKLNEVAAFYRDHGLPPRVQLSAASRPAWLDAELERRGWRHDPGAWVMFRAAVQGTGEGASSEAGPGGAGAAGAAAGIGGTGSAARADRFEGVHRSRAPDEAYLRVQRAVTPGAADTASARAEALQAVGLKPWHLVLSEDDRPISAGLGVYDPARGLVGVFSVATVPEARGRGAAGRVMAALAGYARLAGAQGLYLQVDVRNEAARRAYLRSGYVVHHRYDYRVLDGS